jgi:hypothetical protein
VSSKTEEEGSHEDPNDSRINGPEEGVSSCRPMERKELMSKIRADLRERLNSHFSEIYFRVTVDRVSSTEVHNALYELLKSDEISTRGGKWGNR